MQPLYGAIPMLYVPVQITSGTVIAHQYTYALPCCRTFQYHMTFIHLAVSLRYDLGDPLFDGVGLVGFISRANAFLLAKLLTPFLSPSVFPFSSFI